ncbi:MAG: ACT domain-containing protein [Desulfobacteraceae bacterium]|nr:ACT domain-containing protein [Desulfobacteraceae bacterium]
MEPLKLKLLQENLTIHRFDPDDEIPKKVYEARFYNVVKTREEISIVCTSDLKLNSWNQEKDWSMIKVMGPLDFSLTGILSGIAGVLAEAKIGIFVISTFDTDYFLVKSQDTHLAMAALQKAGYQFV